MVSFVTSPRTSSKTDLMPSSLRPKDCASQSTKRRISSVGICGSMIPRMLADPSIELTDHGKPREKMRGEKRGQTGLFRILRESRMRIRVLYDFHSDVID